jgi:two-component system, chemotaxis family, response regulator WspF
VLGPQGRGEGAAALLAKIEMLARLTGPAFAGPSAKQTVASSPRRNRGDQPGCLVAIGTSAGGPAALAQILGALPASFPAVIVAVQHLDEQFAAGLADWLGQQTALPVRLAREREPLAPGAVLLAGRGEHLILRENSLLGYTAEPAGMSYRPSVDVFMDSVAEHWSGAAIGVILTGMGRDGARGLKRMRDAGHATFAQDQGSCAVYGMPKAAAELGAAAQVLPLAEIAPALVRHVATASPHIL